MPASLTVLLATHGRPTLLGRTLASVASCDRPPGYAGCIVVENGPRAGAERIVAETAQEHPEAAFRYLYHGRANKSAALNAALDAVPPDHLVVFLDDDVRVERGSLVAYAEAAADRSPGTAFFGGGTESDFEDRPPDWLLPFFPESVKGLRLDEPLEQFLGFNWAAWAQDLAAAGGFDPNFGPGSPTGARGQEGEMQNRLRQAGLEPVAVPEAVVWHYIPRDRSSRRWLLRRKYLHGIAAAQFDRTTRTQGAVATEAAGRLVRSVGATVTKTLRRDEVGLWRALLGVSTFAGRLVGAFRGEPPASRSATP